MHYLNYYNLRVQLLCTHVPGQGHKVKVNTELHIIYWTIAVSVIIIEGKTNLTVILSIYIHIFSFMHKTIVHKPVLVPLLNKG